MSGALVDVWATVVACILKKAEPIAALDVFVNLTSNAAYAG